MAQLYSKVTSALLELAERGQNVKPQNIKTLLKKAGATDLEITKSGVEELAQQATKNEKGQVLSKDLADIITKRQDLPTESDRITGEILENTSIEKVQKADIFSVIKSKFKNNKPTSYYDYTLPNTKAEEYKVDIYTSDKFDELGQYPTNHFNVDEYQFHVRYDDTYGAEGIIVNTKDIYKDLELGIKKSISRTMNNDVAGALSNMFRLEGLDLLETLNNSPFDKKTFKEALFQQTRKKDPLELEEFLYQTLEWIQREKPSILSESVNGAKPIRRIQEIQSDVMNEAQKTYQNEKKIFDFFTSSTDNSPISNVHEIHKYFSKIAEDKLINGDSSLVNYFVDELKSVYKSISGRKVVKQRIKDILKNDYYLGELTTEEEALNEFGLDLITSLYTEFYDSSSFLRQIYEGIRDTGIFQKYAKAPVRQTQSFDFVREGLKRQLVDASNEGKEEVWIAINPEGAKSLVRGNTVQKNYETKVVKSAEKLAKQIGGTFKRKKGYAIIGLPAAGFALPLYAQDNGDDTMPHDIITEYLKEGIDPNTIRTVLSEELNMSPAQLDAAMWQSYQPILQEFEDISEDRKKQIALEESIISSLDFDKPQKQPSEALGTKVNQYNSDAQAQYGQLELSQGVYVPPEPEISVDMPPEQIKNALDNIAYYNANDFQSFLGLFSDTMDTKSQKQKQELDQYIINGLNKRGVEAYVTEGGDFEYLDETGNPVKLDSFSLLDFLWRNKFEIEGGILGGVAAGIKMSAAGGFTPPAIAAGAIVGGGGGAAFGRGVDIIMNSLEIKEELDTLQVINQMTDAGIADTVYSVLGMGVFAGAGRVSKEIKNTFKAFKDFVGNKQGALKALYEFTNYTTEQIDELIKNWERITGNVAKGHRFDQAARAYIETEPGGELLIRDAIAGSKTSGSKLRDLVANRAQSVLDVVNDVSTENIGKVVPEKLKEYRSMVQDNFDTIKRIGINLISDTNYRFNYNDIALEPLLKQIENVNITNPAKYKQFERYIEQIRNLGSKQAQKTLDATGIEATQETLEQANPLRDFENLLELRRTVNEFRGNQSLKTITGNVQEVFSTMIKRIDKEIENAALTKMDNGNQWLGQWRHELIEYSKMKRMESNVLYKLLNRPGVNYDQAVKALSTRITALDSTFMEVMSKLPPKTRKNVEGSVLNHLTEKYTKGISGGKQSIDFVSLKNTLDHIPFTNPEVRNLKRMINEFAEVYRNDPAIMGVLNRGVGVKDDTNMATSWTGKAKMSFIKETYSSMKSAIPFTVEGRRRALVRNLSKLLDNPLDARTSEDIIRMLPNDPEMKNRIRELATTYAKYGEPEIYNKIPVYTVAKGAPKQSETKLGKGVMYFTDESTAKQIAKSTNSKVQKKNVPPTLIATLEDVSRVIGREATLKDLKDPNVQLKLIDKDFLGVTMEDKVLIFK